MVRHQRATWPAHPAPSRLGYPKPKKHLRILAVVRPAKGEEGLVDPWSAVWMDRREASPWPRGGQVAGSTFTTDGTRCAFFEPETGPDGRVLPYRALSDRDRRLRVPWLEVPAVVRRAVLAAVKEWDASAEYVPIGGIRKELSGKTDEGADANATGHALPGGAP